MSEDIKRLREAMEKGGFMMTEPAPLRDFPRARKLVIGFANPDHADDAMEALANFLREELVA